MGLSVQEMNQHNVILSRNLSYLTGIKYKPYQLFSVVADINQLYRLFVWAELLLAYWGGGQKNPDDMGYLMVLN